MIIEINNPDWPEFCQRLNQQRAGATVKLEVIETDGARTEKIASAVFQNMAFAAIDACTDGITLRFRNDREIVYQIVDPIKILLHPSGGSGDFDQLQFEAENGISFVTFRPPIHEDMLKGLDIN